LVALRRAEARGSDISMNRGGVGSKMKTWLAGAWPGCPLAGPTPELTSRGLGSGCRPWKMVSRGPRGDRPSRLLGPDSRRRPWRRWPGRGDDVVLRSGGLRTASPSEARSNLAEVVVDAEGVVAPLPASRPEPAGSECLVACAFCGRRGQNTHPRCVVKLRLFSSCFEYLDFFLSVTGLFVRARVASRGR
jgi:hypothetical protein